MNWGALADNLLFVLLLLGVGFLIFFFRLGRHPERTRAEIARNLRTEVILNQAMAEFFKRVRKPRMFEVACWQMNKTRLGFLPKSLQGSLSETFTLAEEYNRQIRAARKQKSAGPLAKVDTDKLKEPLEKARKGLEEWLQINVGTIEQPLKYPSFFDSLFGGRGD